MYISNALCTFFTLLCQRRRLLFLQNVVIAPIPFTQEQIGKANRARISNTSRMFTGLIMDTRNSSCGKKSSSAIKLIPSPREKKIEPFQNFYRRKSVRMCEFLMNFRTASIDKTDKGASAYPYISSWPLHSHPTYPVNCWEWLGHSLWKDGR